jgi:N-glycosylase/DNA lyase
MVDVRSTMMQLCLPPSFDLNLTLCCGQTFMWEKQGIWWYGVVGGKVLKVRQMGDMLEFANASELFVRKYFGMNDDLKDIFSQINKDRYVEAAVDKFNGLRVLRQDPWECLISYICATYKNIAAIKRMLLQLSRKFGQKVVLDGRSFFTFPTPMKLATATLRNLRECELGYRAKYVSQTAKQICESGFELDRLKKATHDHAREELLRFPGVGLKVADCVLLFSLEKLDAFPVDVWVRRAVLRYYAAGFPREFVNRMSRQKSLSSSDYERLNLFGREYFGKYAGYAQEYLYHYERTENRSHV